ncbi:hypothetical protein MRX96_037306 [Rhipicephalus microplus]
MMASWRFTTLALLLIGVQSALCIDDVDEKCDRLPKNYPDDVCRSEEELPEDSVCEEYYSACKAPERELFKHKEKGYASLRFLLLNKTMCEGVKKLEFCIRKENMSNCNAGFSSLDYSIENAEKNEMAAKNLSDCLEYALRPCLIAKAVTLSKYMKELATAINDLFKVPKHPPADNDNLGALNCHRLHNTQAHHTHNRTACHYTDPRACDSYNRGASNHAA